MSQEKAKCVRCLQSEASESNDDKEPRKENDQKVLCGDTDFYIGIEWQHLDIFFHIVIYIIGVRMLVCVYDF